MHPLNAPFHPLAYARQVYLATTIGGTVKEAGHCNVDIHFHSPVWLRSRYCVRYRNGMSESGYSPLRIHKKAGWKNTNSPNLLRRNRLGRKINFVFFAVAFLCIDCEGTE